MIDLTNEALAVFAGSVDGLNRGSGPAIVPKAPAPGGV